ncbi:Probable 1-acyl-sn-glycerol-3-phosphate acyltransferase 5 [Striga hermonthica]|uniref:1-acylglycerol-3-phosphate O-acyltransferase n=1 Tax=Striga hermonthica TaxID=68872 RepID=A0A9N7NF55_STRHE|nr:Probable 1-acyl-sn-glycerol-3-phosphate acyltransferase 5 [Striga hermonthica]
MESFLEPKQSPKKHRSLTPSRLIKGIICLIILISTAFVLLVYFGFWTAVPLRLVSVHHSRKATALFFGSWIALWPFLFEKINGTKVCFSGDRLPVERRVLLIANHRTEVDWMYLWDLALRKGCEGYLKYVLKSSLMRLPVFGWVFHVMEFIPVERKWVVDEFKMCRILSSFRDSRDPMWLALFPEGTDFTEQKCARSQKHASENGLPVLKNVLLPKTRGFYACLETLRDSLDAVYDITIGYRHNCPSFLDNAFGVDPSEVHIHVRRVCPNELPKSEDEVSSWLTSTFELKDQMLSEFYKTGHFPNEGTEGNLSTMKCMANFVVVMILTGTCVVLSFQYVWFKVYVALVCSYLATTTYLDVRPFPLFRQ